MLHDSRQLNGLLSFINTANLGNTSVFDIFNQWVIATGIDIHDSETVDFYLKAIPMIKRKVQYGMEQGC